ncbi:hypothetical protein GGS20DRAFT_594153 [Poronia punctata]|nr:hypothetical protein GGS20DRAFT_594153 [Poronia punctata]
MFTVEDEADGPESYSSDGHVGYKERGIALRWVAKSDRPPNITTYPQLSNTGHHYPISRNSTNMAPVLNVLAILALTSAKALAGPAVPGIIGNLFPTYSNEPPPYPTSTASAPGTTVTVTIPPTTVTATTTVTTTTTVASCAPTLSCDKYGYLVQNVTLFQVDLATGRYTNINTDIGDASPINAIAYNTLDNYLYARQAGRNQLIRIALDGLAEVVATMPTADGVNIGDIDSDGNYWYAGSGKWFQVDLRPNSSTYGTLLSNGSLDLGPLGLSLADWAYIPVGGPYLYTAAAQNGQTVLARFSLETKAWEVVENYGRQIAQNGWGAVYAMNNGTLYASDNASGEIWAFPILGGQPYMSSQGPVSGSNDGARCVLNLEV